MKRRSAVQLLLLLPLTKQTSIKIETLKAETFIWYLNDKAKYLVRYNDKEVEIKAKELFEALL